MQPALLVVFILPPPTAGTKILTGLNGPGAGGTAYAYKTFVV